MSPLAAIVMALYYLIGVGVPAAVIAGIIYHARRSPWGR